MKLLFPMRKLLGIFLTLLAPLASHAQTPGAYPTRAIHIIVPYPPGGSNNVLARLVAQKLSERWGQQVVVDNRPGGNTVIGSDALLKAPPDGYTLMLTSNSHVITPLLINTPYDPIKDFSPISSLAISENVLVVHPSLPTRTLAEFIALAKSKPRQLNFASSGAGSPTHLAAALFEMLTGVKMQHIPYKGGGPAIIDLIGGHVQLHFNTPINLIPHVRSGKIRALAITGAGRFKALPDVPTFAEAGLRTFDLKTWFCTFVPVGTPRDIIETLSGEFARMMAIPDFKEKLDDLGMSPFVSPSDKFTVWMKAESVTLARVIKEGNVKLEH